MALDKTVKETRVYVEGVDIPETDQEKIMHQIGISISAPYERAWKILSASSRLSGTTQTSIQLGCLSGPVGMGSL